MYKKRAPYPRTPDGRYFIVRGCLWRTTNPTLDDAAQSALTVDLMTARRAKQKAMRSNNPKGGEMARLRIEAAMQALGERGAVWWTDGAPDLNRRLARNTP